MKDPISGRLLTDAILKVIENLPLPKVIQIRDLCNEIVIKSTTPPLPEPEEFRTWRVIRQQ